MTRTWLVGEGIGLAHEFGHSFIDDYVHWDGCTNHLMRTSVNSGERNVLRVTDVGNIHRNLARTNLRRFVDCGETYNTTSADRQVTTNDFSDFDFDIAINGITESDIIDNLFKGVAAGNQFENTNDRKNTTLCNRYIGNIVGTNIVGGNTGYFFRQEDFATKFHDLFIEGTTPNPGAVQLGQGTNPCSPY